jgi:hypothetical protein
VTKKKVEKMEIITASGQQPLQSPKLVGFITERF